MTIPVVVVVILWSLSIHINWVLASPVLGSSLSETVEWLAAFGVVGHEGRLDG